MSSPSIQSALQQMQGLAAQAAQPIKGEHVATAVGQGGFGSELQSSIQRINRLQQAASTRAMAFQAGEPNIELNDVRYAKSQCGLSNGHASAQPPSNCLS